MSYLPLGWVAGRGPEMPPKLGMWEKDRLVEWLCPVGIWWAGGRRAWCQESPATTPGRPEVSAGLGRFN